jgi:kumamolisin
VPAFQQSANLPVSVNDGQHRRGVPDVAGDASPFSGYLIVLNGSTTTLGGTSAVAPLWAGLTALVNQAASRPIGFFLPTLYQNPQVMRDITQGDNKPPGSNLGYTAGPGWDACTGLGAPNGDALLKASAIRCVGWANDVAGIQAEIEACASDTACTKSALVVLVNRLKLALAGLRTCENKLIG